MNKINKIIQESIDCKKQLLTDDYVDIINKIGITIIDCLKKDNKILIAGNGGSAADAQNFAAELAGKFEIENRKALATVALTTNTSIISAIGNDFGFDSVFARQVEALGNKGDIFFGISTSGNSKNLIRAIKTAKQKGLLAIGLLGKKGGEMKAMCDLCLVVPRDSTPRIQEVHIMLIHIICKIIDDYFKDEE